MITEWGYAQDTPDSKQNEKGIWNRTLKFVATCSSLFDADVIVLDYPLCPQIGDTYRFDGPAQYEYDAGCVVTDRQATRRDANQPVWDVTITYKTPEAEKPQNDDPINEPVEAKGSGESFKEVAQGTISSSQDMAFNGAICNSAGEPFRNPTPEKESGYNVLTLVKNYPITFDILALNEDYAYHVSTDTFFGRPKGQWMMFPCTWELKRKEPTKQLPLGRDYIRVTFTFKNKKKGWKLELCDIGSFYLGAAGSPVAGKKMAFKGNDGQPYLGLLDGQGGKNPDGAPAVFLPPKMIQGEKAFSVLNLPNSLAECKKFLA
ncbi:hypothetical protein [Anatilimnocola floriformis]|uniref:hypothetical protein n=1 Tax=Anatilimnocola floriformis TaxID=2948575 RepID=UPI0020C4A15C|nr:hypothetical protein [Anatilimnocola floriformis]